MALAHEVMCLFAKRRIHLSSSVRWTFKKYINSHFLQNKIYSPERKCNFPKCDPYVVAQKYTFFIFKKLISSVQCWDSEPDE